MCLYSQLIDNPKYKPNKKNGGNPPPVLDERAKKVAIGCGHCRMCKRRRANEWKVRLAEELRVRKGIFVTLTFSEESLIELEDKLENRHELKGTDFDDALAAKAIQLFSARFKKKYKRRPRRWFVTELGGTRTERIHLHGIIFEKLNTEELEQLWKYGNVWIGDYCDGSSANYIVKYMTKVDKKHKYYKGRVFCSPGIGKAYTERVDYEYQKFDGENTRDWYRWRNGFKSALPMYYRNKRYSEEEREKLWMMSLDKGERWVDGVCIKTDHPRFEEYYKAVLEDKQKLNRFLGYGSPDDYDAMKAQEDMREQLRITRRRKVWAMNNKEYLC